LDEPISNRLHPSFQIQFKYQRDFSLTIPGMGASKDKDNGNLESGTKWTPGTERRRSTGSHLVDENIREGETIEGVRYPPAIQPERAAREPDDAGVPRALLRPTEAPPPPVRKILRDMHRVIQFNPDFKILETSQKIVQMCLLIRAQLGAHDDMDVESFNIPAAGCTPELGVPEYSERLVNPEPPKIEPLGGGSSAGFIGKG
jgi:hypothetical protein